MPDPRSLREAVRELDGLIEAGDGYTLEVEDYDFLVRLRALLAAVPEPIRYARDCRCGTDPTTGEQVTWCKAHNGWEYGRKMDALRQAAEERRVTQ